MSVNPAIEKALAKLAFQNREEDFHHHSYEDDMNQYEYIKRGDMTAVEIGRKMFEGPNTGSLSDDPVKNYQYLFVSSITLACRFCIEGGMPLEDAFNISDLYIRRVDACRTVEEIFSLHDIMVRDYTARMQVITHRSAYSRPVHCCMDYIEHHLQQPITVVELARELGISASYLSVIFMKETGMAVSAYIRRQRVEAAKALLQYTEYSCLEISEHLCFSSDSHFARVFREHTGMTPAQYRKIHYRKHWEFGGNSKT